jgi:NADPH-ferrihemoprotein reductase
VLGFLTAFPSIDIPIGQFIEVMPKNNPRFYSIASDQLVQKDHILLTVALVDGGHCSDQFRRLKVGEQLPIFVRKSTFHLPIRAKNRPLILIGPGTGIAPLIGFCYRRQAWVAKKQEIGECYLFFGCRRRNEDYLHQTELESWSAPASDGSAPIISNLLVAFSREQAQKVYVQHLIQENAAKLADLICKQGASIYICGDANHMAKDVEQVLIDDILVRCGGMTKEMAQRKLEEMEKSDKYLKDVWTS